MALKRPKLPPPIIAPEVQKTLHFPHGGLHVVCPLEQQPNVVVSQTDKTDYGRTTPAGVNVRCYELSTQRRRGASRAGLKKYIPGSAYFAAANARLSVPPVQVGPLVRSRHFTEQVYPGIRLGGRQSTAQVVQTGRPTRVIIRVGEEAVRGFIQSIALIVSTPDAAPTKKSGGKVQPSLSGRAVTLVVVSGGNVVVAVSGDQVWSTTINNTKFDPPLNANGVVYSSACNQKLWFADGSNWCVYTPSTNSVDTWKPSAGVLPVDAAGNTPRLICTWRGRIVLSGTIYDPQNIFFSAVSDPTNWNYLPKSPSATDAFALNVGQLGFVGDVVTALIPYKDDILLVGGDHELHMLQGDPQAGGQLDLISDTIGVAWGMAWCKDPYGVVYFVSNRMGIYTLTPGQSPLRISQAIEPLLQALDSGANTFTCVYDDRYQGVHFFVTPTAGPAPAMHFFYEARTNAWWVDQFANNDHNPLACAIYDGNNPNDRVALIGSWSGFVNYLDPNAADDDGTPIASTVTIGPLNTPDYDEVLCKDCQAVLGETSGDVNYEILVGSTAEEALSSAPIESGTWQAGRNLSTHVRFSGHAIYLRLSSTVPWAMEGIRLRLEAQGKVRARGF